MSPLRGWLWAVQWRTDNPVRPPEKTSPRPAFWWLHDSTDRIVRPPRILPFTALRARSRAGLSAQRPPRHSLFAAGVDARRTDNPGRFSGGRTILSVPPRERPRGRHFGGSTIRRTGLSGLHASLQVDIERRARRSKMGGAA